jgi:DNA repair photolyase
MKEYKNALKVRGDSNFCPLSFSIDSYFNCLVDCHHCSFRSINHVWGMDLRPANPEEIRTKLTNGQNNINPKSSLAYCISSKKTIRFGSRSDPFQPAEDEHGVSKRILQILCDLDWTFVVQTRFPSRLWKNKALLLENKKLFTFIPVISPGLEKDWETLERSITDPPEVRLKIANRCIQHGINTGVNGEPFIPGYHTEKDFEETLKRLKQYNIPSYNTYNFHFNPYVAKRLNAINVDIERIWYYNQDKQWYPILQKLISLAKKYNILLGCPDFVNSGWGYIEPANTCCGVNVPNGTTFNTHIWKKMIQTGNTTVKKIIEDSWDGVGDYHQGCKIISDRHSKEFYTLNDIKK